MNNGFESLTNIQTDILKNRILYQPERPFAWSFGALYGSLDIEKYSEEEVKNALNDLVSRDFLTKKDNSYIFSRGQFLKTRSFFKIKNKSKWSFKLKASTAAIIAAIITALPSYFVGYKAFLKDNISDESVIYKRIDKQLGKRVGFENYIYPRMGFGFSAPKEWKIEDFATNFGVGDIDVAYRYTSKKALIGVEFKLITTQANYINNFKDEVANQSIVLKKIDPQSKVSDHSVAGKFGKKFIWNQSTGQRVGEIQMYWTRLLPEIRLQIMTFIYTDEPDKENFDRAANDIVNSIIIDEDYLQKKRRQLLGIGE